VKPPYIEGALKGWTQKLTATVITKTVVDHRVVETAVTMVLDINYQPMPSTQVNRKPEEQRTWIWWTLIIKGKTPLLKTDDMVSLNGFNFRIQSGVRNIRTSGASIYEAIQDFMEPSS
jgi:hypothetical protein